MNARQAIYEYNPNQEFIDLHAWYFERYRAHKDDLAVILADSLADDGYDLDFGLSEMLEKYEDVYQRLVNPSDYEPDEPPHLIGWADYL